MHCLTTLSQARHHPKGPDIFQKDRICTSDLNSIDSGPNKNHLVNGSDFQYIVLFSKWILDSDESDFRICDYEPNLNPLLEKGEDVIVKSDNDLNLSTTDEDSHARATNIY